MSKWMIYVDVSYYPSAHIVEADTFDEACKIAREINGSPGYPIDEATELAFMGARLEDVHFGGSDERIAKGIEYDNERLYDIEHPYPSPEWTPEMAEEAARRYANRTVTVTQANGESYTQVFVDGVLQH